MNSKLITLVAATIPLFASQTAMADNAEETLYSDDGPEIVEESDENEQFSTNVSANPFFLAFGGIQGGVSFRVDETKAVGVVGSTLSLFGSKVSTIGVQGQYQLQDGDVMDDGLLLDGSAELLFASYDYGYDEYGYMQESHTGIIATTSLVYQWVYDNGLNLRAGAGIATTIGLDSDVGYTGAGGSGIAALSDSVAVHGFIDGKVAWAF